LIENYESIVKEIDEMLFFRKIDQLIKKHEEKKTQNNIKEDINKIQKNDNQDLTNNFEYKQKNCTKEEIFEFPVKRIKKTIELTC
jgi:hypothetical protein